MHQRSKGRSKGQDFIFPLTHHFRNTSHHHGYWSTGNTTLTTAAAEMLGWLLPGKHLEQSEEAQISPQVQENHSKSSLCPLLTPSSRHWSLSPYIWIQASQVGESWIWDYSQNVIATRLHLVLQIPKKPVGITETSKHGGSRTYGEGQRWESISLPD